MQGEITDCMLEADPQQLRQVLINLVQNAAESIGGGGRITLRRKPMAPLPGAGARDFVLEVADTGKGIPTELHAHLFDPFFTDKPSGTGLGLPTAARVIARHRRNHLVFERGQPGDHLYRRAACGGVRMSQSATILMVEDDRGIAASLRRVLEEEGHEVLSAANGQEGLEVALSQRCDLVLTDFKLPDSRAWSFFRNWPRRGHACPSS